VNYRSGYKYQLAKTEFLKTSFRPETNIYTTRIKLYTDGELVVMEGYSYDGPSGPVIDRKTNMRAALGHDALYQLMRMGLLSHRNWRRADHDFGKWLKEDGAWSITVKIDLLGLEIAGGRSAHPKNRKKIHEAP